MAKKQVTITFGTSVHYFKSSVSITWDVDNSFDMASARKEAKKEYLKVLEQELDLAKKFDKMTTKEIRKYLKSNGG